jgi:hypothetical protein
MDKKIPKTINSKTIKTENKGKIGSFLLLLGSLVFVFGAGEIVFGNIGIAVTEIESISGTNQFNIHWGIEPKPNIKYEEYGFLVSTNKDAMYGPEIPKVKKGMRVAYLGDSYTVGPGISFEKNYPTLVTQTLKNHFGNETDMVIGGIAGSSPSQQKIIFERKILPYDPDLVVYETYSNDILDDFNFRYSSYIARINTYSNIPKFLLKSRFAQHATIFFAEQVTKFNNYLHDKLSNSFSQKPQEKWWKKLTKPAFDDILRLARNHDAKFFLVHIPDGIVFKDEYGFSDPVRGEWTTFLQQATNQWAKENGIPYIDMYETFLEHNTAKLNELYLPSERGYHLTELGASLTAQKIIQLILNTSQKN